MVSMTSRYAEEETEERGSDVLNAKLLGAPSQQLVEFRLGGPHDHLLQRLCQLVDRT
jgi:hypothetical protein